MQFSIEVTDAAKLAGLQRALALYNSMNEPKTEAEFLQWQVDNQLSEYARTLTVRFISPLAFLSRFTPQERITIRQAAKTDPEVEDYLAMLNAAKEDIDLTDPRTVGGVALIDSKKLLEHAGRAAEILAL